MMDAWQSEMDYLQEIGARLEINGSTGEPSARPVLDAGKFGLEFFRMFGPAYAAVTGGGRDIDAKRYDVHGEIDYGRLHADAQRHQDVASALAERMLDIRNGASPLFEAWQGEAAGQAKGRFDSFFTGGEALRSKVAGLGGVLAESVDAADRAVYEKATAVADLWTDRIDTRTASDVDFVIDFCRRCGSTAPGLLVDDDELERVAEMHGTGVTPAQCRTNPVLFKQLVTRVRSWLKSVFVPFYQARIEAFDTACAAADAEIDQAWQAVTQALGDLPADPFGEVAGQAMAPAAPTVPTVPTAPAAQSMVTSDRPLPDTPANRAGGISTTLDDPALDDPGTDATEPDPVGASDNAMHPSAGPAPQPVLTPVTPVAPAAGGQPGNTFYGTPFFGAGANRGGGDNDHKSGVPLAGLSTEDLVPDHGGHTIGADDDPLLYNEDAVQAVDDPKPKKSLLDELLDDEHLW